MTEFETELEMVQRHTRQGLVRVTRQQARVVKMRETGRSTGLAEEMLQILSYLQKEHEAHLNRLTLREQRDAIFRDCNRISVAL
ncbi:MAG: hypothetical protein ACRYGI_09480 [Janthinobacterium lividum]